VQPSLQINKSVLDIGVVAKPFVGVRNSIAFCIEEGWELIETQFALAILFVVLEKADEEISHLLVRYLFYLFTGTVGPFLKFLGWGRETESGLVHRRESHSERRSLSTSSRLFRSHSHDL